MKSEQVLIAATTEELKKHILTARKRLVVLAPAVKKEVAVAIREQWIALGSDRVSVTLDVDAEVYRLGYGDFEALALLEATGGEVDSLLQRQPGVRIGLIISDDAVLVYSPVPELIEAGPRDPSNPTGVLIRQRLPAIENALGVGEQGVVKQEIGLDKATISEIETVKENLATNPPQKFDVARQLNVFNAAFQFVELTVSGTKVHQRKVNIPNYLLGVEDEKLQSEISAALKVVPRDHKLSGTKFDKMRNRIEKDYLRLIPHYGYVVLRTDKAAFEEKITLLKQQVKKFKEELRDGLGDELKERVDSLTDMLLPALLDAPPAHWLITERSSEERANNIRRALVDELWDAIGSAGDYADDVVVKVLFKDVTYELLNDDKFKAAAIAALPREKVPQLHTEFGVAPSVNRVTHR